MHEFYCMENRAEWRESPCAEAEIERDEQETCLNGFDCWLLPVRVRQQRQLNGYAIWLLCLLCQSNIHSYAYVSCTSSAHVRSGFFVVLLADVLIPAPGNNYNLYENECKIIINRKQTRTDGKSISKTLFLVCGFFRATSTSTNSTSTSTANWMRTNGKHSIGSKSKREQNKY